MALAAPPGGKLVLVTQEGSIPEKQDPLRDHFILDRPLPENYTVTAKLSLTARNQVNSAAILIYQDKDTYLSLGCWGKPWGNNVRRTLLFAKEVEGRMNLLEFEPHEVGGEGGTRKVQLIGARNNPEAIWLKLEKRGSAFTGSFSVDGAHWHKVGDHTMLRMGNARLALAASNLNADAAEVAAEFDFVEVAPAL